MFIPLFRIVGIAGFCCLLLSCGGSSHNTPNVANQTDTITSPAVSKPDTRTYLAKAELNKKFGCLDTKGHEVIPVRYDDMGFWGNDLIPVNIGAKEVEYSKKGGKWGYCNSKGELVIPVQFDKAETFHEGLAAVQLQGKWGFIDTTGKIVIVPKYDDARIFHEGLCAVAQKRQWGMIDRTGKEVIPFEYGELSEFGQGVARAFVGLMANSEEEETKGYYCLIDKKGKRIIPPIYKMIWNFSEGLARVEVQNTADEYETKKGFINLKGEVVVPLIYDDAEDFHEGMAVVGFRSATEPSMGLDDTRTYGYVNEKGEEVIKPQFSRAYDFKKGRAVVCKGRGRSFEMTVVENDSIIVDYENKMKFALIDSKGKFLLDFDWRSLTPIDNDLFVAERAKYAGAGVINIKGETVVTFKYINLEYIGEGLLTANDGHQANGESTLIDIHNQVLFKTRKYEMPAAKYQFGLLNVRTNGLRKSAFIDVQGKPVIPDKYDMIWDFGPTIE